MKPLVKIFLAAAVCFIAPSIANADTYVYVQNNTPFAFPVEIVRPSGLALGTQYWKSGVSFINPGQRARIYQTNRDSGVKSGKYYEFHCMLSMDGSKFALKQRLKGTTFFSDLWQSVQGQSWYSDRSTHQATWDTGKTRFNIKYRAYFTGGADDIEYIIQYKYPKLNDGANVLNVLSYNTYMRPTSLFINGQSVRNTLMMPELRNQGYDVIIFSEMFDDDIRGAMKVALSAEFPHQTRILGTDRGVEQDGGVIIVSRWPLVTQDQRLYGSVSSGSDGMADKGVMYACINKMGRKYHIFGSHTQANKDAAARAARKRQLEIIKSFVDSKKIPATEAVVIGGDLNVDKTGSPAEYQQMLTILDAIPPLYLGNLKATWDPTINKCADAGTPEYLDFVFASKNHLKPLIVTNEVRPLRSWEEWKALPTDKARWDLSDHFPVYGRLHFKP